MYKDKLELSCANLSSSLTLCAPRFFILVFTWGRGPQDPQLYFVFLDLVYVP